MSCTYARACMIDDRERLSGEGVRVRCGGLSARVCEGVIVQALLCALVYCVCADIFMYVCMYVCMHVLSRGESLAPQSQTY